MTNVIVLGFVSVLSLNRQIKNNVMVKHKVHSVVKEKLITYLVCQFKNITAKEYKTFEFRSPQTRLILNKLSREDLLWLVKIFEKRIGG